MNALIIAGIVLLLVPCSIALVQFFADCCRDRNWLPMALVIGCILVLFGLLMEGGVR